MRGFSGFIGESWESEALKFLSGLQLTSSDLESVDEDNWVCWQQDRSVVADNLWMASHNSSSVEHFNCLASIDWALSIPRKLSSKWNNWIFRRALRQVWLYSLTLCFTALKVFVSDKKASCWKCIFKQLLSLGHLFYSRAFILEHSAHLCSLSVLLF